MTAFITPCWNVSAKSLRSANSAGQRFGLRGFLAALFIGFLLMPLHKAWAGPAEISLKNPQVSSVDDGFAVSADVSIDLGSKLEDALLRGLPLFFVHEFEMTKPRWYWIEDKRFSRSQSYRIYYHALTRQYRVGAGAIHPSFATLDEALRYLGNIRQWRVIDRADLSDLKVGETYQATLRLRLDTAQLPRPLQISVLFAREWELSGEVRWAYTVPPVDSKVENKAVDAK